MLETGKLMFEIYRENYSQTYRVVYFTELNDHNRDTEIGKALAGEHFYNGFIREFRKEDAKRIIDGVLDRLNDGESVTSDELEEALANHLPVGAP
ncbi:MAG: hypothetical protein FJY97_00930 [candidate division Zixibacteria bacterium]|nr:hypothetical protein [candidate division Zixibacteria bacterium]